MLLPFIKYIFYFWTRAYVLLEYTYSALYFGAYGLDYWIFVIVVSELLHNLIIL